MTFARVTQVAVETVSSVNPRAQITQAAIEVISSVVARAQVTQVAIEVISTVAEVVPSTGGKRKPRPWQAGSRRGNSYKKP